MTQRASAGTCIAKRASATSEARLANRRNILRVRLIGRGITDGLSGFSVGLREKVIVLRRVRLVKQQPGQGKMDSPGTSGDTQGLPELILSLARLFHRNQRLRQPERSELRRRIGTHDTAKAACRLPRLVAHQPEVSQLNQSISIVGILL